jgi:hypothetical protein
LSRRSRGLVCVAAVVAFVFTASAGAGEPPNQNDPCSKGGRNTCGTLGIGSYETYRYGIRWFGDYRGAVPGVAHTYCIDLRYWYPSARHRFREDRSPTLRNRDGAVVSLERRRRMAHAVWSAGRTTSRTQAAAVMLYVHGLMGDAAPGEVAPDTIGGEVAAAVALIARNAERYHGPYRILTSLPDGLRAGKAARATIRVVSADGNSVPDIAIRLATRGTLPAPASVRTNRDGVARLEITPSGTDEVRLEIRTAPLASTLPRIFQPTAAGAARNGQRLVVPASQTVTETVTRSVTKLRLAVTTDVEPDVVLVGEPTRDRVVISGALPGWTASVAVRVHGPFATRSAIRCDGTPAWHGTFTARGAGTYTTPAATIDAPGWYTYQLEIPDDAEHIGLTTPCAVPAESFRVEVQPRVTTVVSAQRVQPGTAVTDLVRVEGLRGERATIRAFLYGPYPSRETIDCAGPPVWSGTLEAVGDGELTTEPVTLSVPGFYTYRESIAATGFVRGATTACGEVAETTVVVAVPRVTTRVSTQRAAVGATITDHVVVAGLGRLTVTVEAELFGPFTTRAAIRCDGTPAWKGSVVAAGDGTYTTAPYRIERAGYYTYRESIAEGPANASVRTECGEESETTVARAAPRVTTLVSDEVVRPGGKLHDRIRVTGLGATDAVVELEPYGPFASRDAIRCTGSPLWRGRIAVKGDGAYSSPAVVVERAGFYTYRERLVETPLVVGSRAPCGVVAETSLARPLIVTGGRSVARAERGTTDAAGRTPTRVRVPALGIDAPVTPSVVGLASGALATPTDIRRAGWWSDGAAPGAPTGAILMAGHVDSARRGAGAFFRLRSARRGETIQVTTRDRATRTYRVVSVRAYPKESLPTDVFSRRGPARLVLVTCGGPFDRRSGRYRDNVVVTAVPA